MKPGILICGNFRLPDKGASACRVAANAKLFNSLGCSTYLLGVSDEQFSGVRSVEGCECFFEQSYPRSSVQWFKHMVSVKNIAFAAEKVPNIKLVILYNAPYSLVLAVKHRLKGIKLAYDCTEWNPDADGNAIKRTMKKLDERLIRNRIHKLIPDLIVISTLMQQQYKSANSLLLPPLVDLKDPIWTQCRQKNDAFTLCFAGDINGTKERLDVVVAAVGSINDIVLNVLGVTKEKFAACYPSIEAGENIRFLGQVSHAEAIEFVLSCDAYVFLRESTLRNNAGFATKFAEAVTAGAPLITTNVSDFSFYAGENDVLIDTVNERSFADAIAFVRSFPHRRKEINPTFDFNNYCDLAFDWLKSLQIY